MNGGETHSRYEPLSWLVLFQTRTGYRWLDRLVLGRFKHVMAMGWVEATRTWLFYEVSFARTRVMVLPEDVGTELVAQKIVADPGAVVLRVPVNLDGCGIGRMGFWCVPAVKHLLGMRSGALRPDRLWRDCIASAGEIVYDAARTAALSAEPAGNRGAARG